MDNLTDIPGYPGYQASRDGQIYTRWKRLGLGKGNGTRAVIGCESKPLVGSCDKDGYRRVILCDGHGKRSYHRVHDLILETFIGPCPDGMVGAHEDGDPTNNRASNLAWKTQKENIADKRRHGTHQAGSKHPHAKLTEEIVLQIRESRRLGVTLKSLSEAYGVPMPSIRAIVYRYQWKHI